MEKAIEYLREKGLAANAKKAGRVAADGIVDSYIHMGGKIGVLLEVNCETDFVANTDAFRSLCHDLALQIAASNPLFVSKEDVPTANLDKATGKEILRLMKLINQHLGMIFIFSTHDQKVVDVSDRLVKMEDGTIKSLGVRYDANQWKLVLVRNLSEMAAGES